MDWITEPGIIDDLVADAQREGFTATTRLIRDWTEAGLLEFPQRRPAGKGHGSRHALYSANQRKLFLTLLHQRSTHRIRGLARIPVALWTYYGNEYVSTEQALRAIHTWAGDARASRKSSRMAARQILGVLNHPLAAEADRQELLDSMATVAYTGQLDRDLERKVRRVFEPGADKIRRAIGHPAAPLTSDSIVAVIQARLNAVALLNDPEVDRESVLNVARQNHLISLAEYAGQQEAMALAAPDNNPTMYERLSTTTMIETVCVDLLTVIGLTITQQAKATNSLHDPNRRN